MHRKQVQAIASINRLQNEMSEKKNLTYDFIDGFRFVSYTKKDKQH